MKAEEYKSNKYTEGICDDGAAILKDGKMMTISEILLELNQNDKKIFDLKYFILEQDKEIKRITSSLYSSELFVEKLRKENKAKDQLIKEMAEALEYLKDTDMYHDYSGVKENIDKTLSKYKEMMK